MMVNTHPSITMEPKTSPATGDIVASVGEIADERRLQHQLRAELALKGKESENRKGASESNEWMPDKPLFIRATSVSDSRVTHFQPGNRRRKETLRRST